MKIYTSLIIVLFSFVIMSCMEKKTIGPAYNEDKYTDQIIITNVSDTTHIMIEYLQYFLNQNDTIPYFFSFSLSDTDLIQLTFYISYGSYGSHPKINKEISNSHDTVYIWYSTIDQPSESLTKSNSIVEVVSEPQIEYIVMDSISIMKNDIKTINLTSKMRSYF